jgi:hypothetical protein
MRRKVGNWYAKDVCIKCHSALNSRDKMYSRGTCPYCGNSNDSTVCDTYKVVIRKVTIIPFLLLPWKRKVSYVGANDRSNAWLDKTRKKEKLDDTRG